MYNFCERITLSVVVTQKNGRKWTYQVNFTHAIHVCKGYYPPDIAANIAKHILPVRPDRKDRRKIIKQKDFVWFLYRVA